MHIRGLRVKFLAGMCLASLSSATTAAEVCRVNADAALFGVGVMAPAAVEPVLADQEARIVQSGDRSKDLDRLTVPAMSFEGQTIDYAIMRLGVMAGRPFLALMDDRQPGPSVTASVEAGTLSGAIERLARAHGLRWRYDGQTVHLFREARWRLRMPDHPDLRAAVASAVQAENPSDMVFRGSDVLFEGDRESALRVGARVATVYAEQRLFPSDVRFYRVYPTSGKISWDRLADRTEAVEAMSFNGDGIGLVLSGTASAVVDAFLAREGRVLPIGEATMVSSMATGPAYRYAGCGDSAMTSRTLKLSSAYVADDRLDFRYEIGGASLQSGQLRVQPGSLVILSDGAPEEGSYMVAVVRPRVVELRAPLADSVPPSPSSALVAGSEAVRQVLVPPSVVAASSGSGSPPN